MVRFSFKECSIKNLLVSGFLLAAIPAMGQSLLHSDTIRIKEVVIISRPVSAILPGFSSSEIDTILLETLNPQSISELLSSGSHLFIKSYGPGGSATPSIRGTAASHTQVSWNGIDISNPMLGQTDFSLINPGMADNIGVYYGGSSSTAGTGSIGGLISLVNNPEWQYGVMAALNPAMGSFGELSSSAKVQAGNERFLSVTKASFYKAENDYPYLNKAATSEPMRETRTHSQFSRKDILQEFYLRSNQHKLSGRIWYQSSDRNLPGSMLMQPQNALETQFDESVRSMISYDAESGRCSYYIKGAWINDRLEYKNPLASINSVNLSNSFTLAAGIENKIARGIALRLLFNEELNLINSVNYENNVAGNNASLTLITEKRAGSRLGASMLLRETMDNNKILIPDFSAGLEYRVLKGEDHFVRTGIARSSRIPSMNERYWYPGGNSNLRNEYAYMFDIGYRIEHDLSSSVRITSEVGFYHNLIRDMIQWHPGEFTFWTADNIKKVNTSGFESDVSFKYSDNLLKVVLRASYSFTKAITAGDEPAAGNQLVYIPENQADGSLYSEYRNFYSFLITSFTGRRYITQDNSDYLDGYSVSTLIIGAKLPVRNNHFDLNFRIENILNADYQALAFYPQPGRSYHISLLLKLNKIVK